MFGDGRRIGAHLPLALGMVPAVERAHAIGATALQIFSDNPTAWRRREEPPPDLDAFRANLASLGIGPVAIHASYLINLAGPEPELRARSSALLQSELASAPTFGAAFVNVHIGSHRDTSVAEGIDRLADAIARLLDEVDDGPDAARLVLENSAGGGFGIGVDIDQLAAIADALADRGVATHRVGFCLDTAHAWGAGIDLADPVAVDAFVDAVDGRIGLDRLALIHLNDSRAELGSRQDRHEHVGAGRIGPVGLARLLTHPRLAHVVTILETPGMDEGYDAVNLDRVRDLIAGRRLADLPPEAFELRSGRARAAPASGDPALAVEAMG